MAATLPHREVRRSLPASDEVGWDLVRAPDTTGLTGTGQVFGKYLYVAPELLGGAEEADARADVYALGMTAVFALHGRELPVSVLRALDRFMDRLDCAEPVRDVLAQATAWAPEDRYENAGAPMPTSSITWVGPGRCARRASSCSTR